MVVLIVLCLGVEFLCSRFAPYVRYHSLVKFGKLCGHLLGK